ncbi:MAG: EscU/YscU/HrcU family type III secretion system export apparatus switch protein, partial [Chlamydiae bacterium]|nr:EscU/YscU/HrcU family type III secretion system export apparatus switch protein [Chlamydiota bacterium]
MAEKTEKATPKKLRDARKKGQVAKSQDFPSAFTFIVSIAATLISAGYIFEQLATYLITTFKSIAQTENLQEKASMVLIDALNVIFKTSVPIALLTTCVGVLTGFLIVGPLFSTEAMKPDIKKLNPINNLKNLFKFKTLFELLKSILKITGALILIYSVVWDSIPEIISSAGLTVYGSALLFNDFLIKVIVRVGIFFLIVAVADLIYQKKNFAKEMKMEKFEVKQEYKDTEGDPHIKSKRRQTAQEIAYQEGPASVKRARAVITNPIHIAVALAYNSEVDASPRILVMGKGSVADQIIKLAVEYNVPVMRNVAL